MVAFSSLDAISDKLSLVRLVFSWLSCSDIYFPPRCGMSLLGGGGGFIERGCTIAVTTALLIFLHSLFLLFSLLPVFEFIAQ